MGILAFTTVMIQYKIAHGRYHGFQYCHDISTMSPMSGIMDISTVMIQYYMAHEQYHRFQFCHYTVLNGPCTPLWNSPQV